MQHWCFSKWMLFHVLLLCIASTFRDMIENFVCANIWVHLYVLLTILIFNVVCANMWVHLYVFTYNFDILLSSDMSEETGYNSFLSFNMRQETLYLPWHPFFFCLNGSILKLTGLLKEGHWTTWNSYNGWNDTVTL
jgi:hypothetical protein